MLILASGEGPTDIGKAKPFGAYDIYGPEGWHPGPMAHFISHFIVKRYHFDPIGSAMWFVPEENLTRIARNIRPMALGKHKEFSKAAQALLACAYSLAQKTQSDVLPVFFRDIDGSRSQDKDERWQDKHDSIAYCLDRIEKGQIYVCPMLPKPKSEAWLLCALKNGYQSCADLEGLSGNDDSPNSAKSILQQHVAHVCQESLVALVKEGKINPDRIDMPSFNAWMQDLQNTRIRTSDLPALVVQHLKNIAKNVQIQDA